MIQCIMLHVHAKHRKSLHLCMNNNEAQYVNDAYVNIALTYWAVIRTDKYFLGHRKLNWYEFAWTCNMKQPWFKKVFICIFEIGVCFISKSVPYVICKDVYAQIIDFFLLKWCLLLLKIQYISLWSPELNFVLWLDFYMEK